MELVKASARQQLPVQEASKPTAQQARAESQPDAAAAKKAEEQTPVRATTNTRGEALGQLLNVKA